MASSFIYLAAVLVVAAAQDLGYIENLHQSSSGDGWVEISWDGVPGDSAYPFHKYNLLTDNDFSNDVLCPTASCTYRINYLEACIEHDFVLTPYFDEPSGGPDLVGEAANCKGFTDEKPPGAPTSLSVVAEDDDGTTIQWSPPTQNPDCVEYYKVCSRVDGSVATSCETTSDTTIKMSALQACGLYHLTITPYTKSGSAAPPLQDSIVTRDDVPGPPQDVVVGVITEDTIQLLWNNPVVNPLCVDKFVITFGETHMSASYRDTSFEITMGQSGSKVEGYDNEATLSPLAPCTNYTISIHSQNSAEMASEAVVSFAGTAETVPLAPPHVIVGPEGPDSILVIWGENEDDRCVGSFQICWNDGIHPVEMCEEVEGGGDNTFVIKDLLPCTDYQVIVNVVTPGGNYSDPTSNHTMTTDVAPSPVVDLLITDITTNQMSITFGPPETHPQCVKEFDIHIIDEDQTRRSLKELATPSPYVENTITGLKACTNYLVRVSAVTATGKRSGWEEVKNITSGAAPSEPQELGVNDYTQTSITVQWFGPADNSRCVTEYELSWEGSATGSDTLPNNNNFKMTYTVEGLAACSDITFTLLARSDTGDSPSVTFSQTTDGCPV
ncbi:hypothetical protein Pcinc_017858 [Petrolisthes cinctipes]|uniref:Fibronectin type-III domain-containing protein n=1 Tax=Petrolisthes cinctipes TaxID=88211 RepID=A0AAE1KNC2_PETCI|nr:hypothetical protein Pcinc_017858 [Petrolisthes cinctipes]